MIYKWDYKYSEEGDFFYHDWVDMLGGDTMLGEPTPTALDCPGLTFGSVVTTGTITDAWPVAAGEVWSSDYGALGLDGLTLRFTAQQS